MIHLISRRQALVASAATVGCAVVAGYAARTGNNPDKRLAASELKSDLAVWRSAVLERHPRFHGQSALDARTEAAFVAAQEAVGNSMSREQAFVLFAKINPFFRDAHTLLLPWISGDEPGEAEARSQFPFGVDITPDARLLLRSAWHEPASGHDLAQGTEILAINGMRSRDILDRLLPHSHGETAQLRMHMLSVMWPQWLNAIMGWRDHFSIAFANNPAPAIVQWVKGAMWTSVKNGQSADMPTVEWLKGEAALLRVPTFDVDEYPQAFTEAIDAAFRQIRTRKIQHLIIDVRGNTGGQSDAGAQIIRYFLDKPAAQVSRARERLNSDNDGILGYRGLVGSMREIELEDELMQPLPVADRFTGQVSVLIDELTYSASILFATTMQDLKLARLVGRPTGGFANQTGNMMPTRLPGTGFTVFVATRDFIRPSGDERTLPVMPDLLLKDETSDAEIFRLALGPS